MKNVSIRRPVLIDGPVHTVLIKMTIPMIFAMLSVIGFNLIDTYFISHLGTTHLAAMSFTFPVIMVIASISLGLGVGASACISRAIGEGDHDKVKRLTTDSLFLSLLIVLVIVFAGLLVMKPTFTLLGASSETMPLIIDYMCIWYPGVIFLLIPMVGNNAIRATGDTKTASVIMFMGMMLNLLLDPLLIFGLGPFPRLELQGAAIATVIARALTFAISIYVLYGKKRMISLKYPGIGEILHSWRQILYISLPAAASNIIIPVSIAIITRIIATYGPETVAAFGVASRIDMLALIIVMALQASLGPFVGQNIGASRFDRVRLAISYAQKFALVWGLFVCIVLLLGGRFIATLFSANELVVSTITLYFWIVPIAYGMQGLLRLSCQVLNVMRRPAHAAMLGMAQAFLLYVPMACLGSKMIGLEGIFGAATLSYILAGIAAYLLLKRVVSSMEALNH